MTSRDFCYWLQGFMEIGGSSDPSRSPSINHEQYAIIRNHLAMVFKTEIDPSFKPSSQQTLNHLHQGGTGPDVQALVRC